jgi:hypothetical protein
MLILPTMKVGSCLANRRATSAASSPQAPSDWAAWSPIWIINSATFIRAIRHQADSEATAPVVNSLVWQEGDSWWRLSALAPESGGQYGADDLVGIARNRLQESVAQVDVWRPAIIE